MNILIQLVINYLEGVDMVFFVCHYMSVLGVFVLVGNTH